MNAQRTSRVAAMVWLLATASALPQIVTDATFAPQVPANFRLPAIGDHYEIGDGLGVRHGPNRFHSFTEFNVPSSKTVLFSSQFPLKNILTRVTGGSESVIEGVLKSSVQDANLFLINPAGIRFATGASLQLTGDFSASSADYLAFEDGGRFNATRPEDTVLTSVPPSAFGLLDPGGAVSRIGAGAPPASLHGSGENNVSVAGAALRVKDGQSLRLVGGDVEIGGTVEAPGGQVLIASARSAGEVPLDPAPGSGVLPMPVQGLVSLRGGALVDATPGTESVRNGRVVIRGGRLEVLGGTIRSDSRRATGGMTVDVAMTGDALITGTIQSDSKAPPGTPHEVSVMARNLEVNRGKISLQTKDSGDGGTLQIHVADKVLLQLAVSAIDAQTVDKASGSGGTVEITTHDFEARATTVKLDNLGAGAGATLKIEADKVTLDGANLFVGTLGKGTGGQVLLGTEEHPVGEVRLTGGAAVIADSSGSGPAGKVLVHAASVAVDSPAVGSGPHERKGFLAQAGTPETASGGQVEIHADRLALGGSTAAVSSGTAGDAPGGTISIDTGSLELSDGASIRSESSGTGEAGAVAIRARDSVTIRGGAAVLASAPLSTANTVQISAGSEVTVLEGTVSAAGARGGEVSVCAGDRIYLLDSTVAASSGSEAGGNVFLGHPTTEGGVPAVTCREPTFVVMNRSTLNASSQGGRGGNVTVGTRHFLPSGDSRIDVTGTEGTGTPSTPPAVDFSGDLARAIEARPEDLAEAREPKDFSASTPAGYTPIGRPEDWEASGERRLILEEKRRSPR